MSTRSDTSSQDTGSIDAAAAAFGALLDREAAPETRQPQPEAEDDEDDTLSDDTVEDSDGDDEDGDADTDEEQEADEAEGDEDGEGDDEDDDAADDDDAEQGAIDLNREVPVKIDGKEVKVKLSEALAGYQRQADYSRKTAEVAEIRRVASEQLQAVNAERAQYAQLLPVLQAKLEAADAEIDWEALKEADPVEYALKRLEAEDRNKQLAAIRSEQDRLTQAAAEEQAAQFNEFVKAERTKLHDAIPAWKDDKVWQRDRAALREYGLKNGFSAEELDGAADSRAVLALYKAMKFDRLTAKQAKGKPAAPTAPSPKPLRPGSANRPAPRVTAKNDAMKRLSRSGSVEDAAAVFMNMDL